jgi:hypothetical protein
MTRRKEHSWNKWDYENRRTPVWVMMLTSAFVSFVSCLDACLDAVGVRPPLIFVAVWISYLYEFIWCSHVCYPEEYCHPKDEAPHPPKRRQVFTQHHIPKDSMLSTFLIRFYVSDIRNKNVLLYKCFYNSTGSTCRAHNPTKISNIRRKGRMQNTCFKKLL